MSLIRTLGIEITIDFAVERRRTVELEIVFAFQYVVEEADASANADLAIAPRIPCKPESWCEVVFVREIRALRSTLVSRKNYTERREREPRGLVARNDRKRSSLGVALGSAVLVADAQR